MKMQEILRDASRLLPIVADHWPEMDENGAELNLLGQCFIEILFNAINGRNEAQPLEINSASGCFRTVPISH